MTNEKQLGLLDRIQPLLLISSIVVGLILSHFLPRLATHLLPVVTIGVFLVIYLIMLSVNLRGILHAFTRWKPTALAIGINFVLTPLFAWLLGYLFLRDDPEIWVGLILYLVTPCIGWYLVFTELAKGDVELGVSLLAWNIFLQVVLMPIYMKVLAGTVAHIDFAEILHSVAVFLILPLLLAFATRLTMRWMRVDYDTFASHVKLPYIKTAILMIVIAAMFASQGSVLFENPSLVIKMIAPGLAFFFGAFSLSLAVGYLFSLNYPEVALLAFTTTARNSEASLAIAVTAFASPLVALTVVIGPSIELPVLILFLRVLLFLRNRGAFGALSSNYGG